MKNKSEFNFAAIASKFDLNDVAFALWKYRYFGMCLLASVCYLLAGQPQKAAEVMKKYDSNQKRVQELSNLGRKLTECETKNRLNPYSGKGKYYKGSGTFKPYEVLVGGDNCPGTVIPNGVYTSASPYTDSDTTVGANNTVQSIQAGCSNYSTNAGPDKIYSFTVGALAPTGKSITMTTTSGTYDASIYILNSSGAGCPAGPSAAATNCVQGSDAGIGGDPETISDTELNSLVVGQTYYLFIDSFYSTSVGSGPYSINIQGITVGSAAPTTFPRSDFNGDGKTDLSVFRPSSGTWEIRQSGGSDVSRPFGISTDVITPSDFDGDNKTDLAVFRATDVVGSPDFYVLRSSDNTLQGAEWGTTGDVPTVSDFDGDNKDDFAVWRSSTGDYWVLQSTAGARHYHFGTAGDKPVPGYFVGGDAKADFGVFRPSTGIWWIADSVSNAVTMTPWGISTDIPVYADYDGDAKDDIAVYRPSEGNWYVLKSSGGSSVTQFGISTDIPVPGDYDGDGKYDQAVYRDGTWYLNRSTSGLAIDYYGLSTDKPTPRWYVPQ